MKQLDKHVYGPWALVTGGSSGIGEEFARQAAASGINVVLLARREERLKEVAAGLTARYDVQARVVAVDHDRDGILDRLAKRGRGGIVLVSAAAAADGLPYMANDSATKAYPLNLGEALHVELSGQAST
jgi:short-subunit dehydrogenase